MPGYRANRKWPNCRQSRILLATRTFIGTTLEALFLDSPSERSRSRDGRYRVGEVGSRGAHRQINCGSQGGPCDPFTPNHAGGTPAPSLLRSDHTLLHPRGRTIRSTLPVFSGSLRPAAHPGIPSSSLHETEAVTRCSDQPSLCVTIFLHPDAQEAVEHCGHSVSEKGSSPTRDSQPGRSGATHRCRTHSLPSHPTDDALRQRSSQRRVDAPEGCRHRQPTDGDSHTRRQRSPGPGCDAQSCPARRTPRALATSAQKVRHLVVSR